MSYKGVAVLVRSPLDMTPGGTAAIFITHQHEEIVLQARPVEARPWEESSRVGFEILDVEHGRQMWTQLCYVPLW